MPSYPRREIVANDEIDVCHCIARCVRRAYLCGDDPMTGNNHEHRKQWIRDRLEQLASVFAIDVCGYAVMSNHVHLV
jgi:REP element-mobilizing transposase RayT